MRKKPCPKNFFLTGILAACLWSWCGSLKAANQEESPHTLKATQTVHTGFFDASIPPVLTVESGDTVSLSTMMLLDGQLRCGMTLEELKAKKQEYSKRKVGPHTMTGPIYIQDAAPGDVLEVRIKKIALVPCGVNYHYPVAARDRGRAEASYAGQIRTLTFDLAKMETTFAPGVIIPLRPFFGVMGVAPKRGEKRPAAVPEYFGGNMDNKELVAGTTLYLPVQVEGALFSCGDVHAAQGDGEVSGTAIETAAGEALLQFFVRKDLRIERPMAETSTHWITMSFHPDLDEAMKMALHDAVQFLSLSKGLTPDDALAIASVAVDFRVTQIVDGNKGVHAMIPKGIFKD